MLNNNTKIKVLNRKNGTVFYDIPDLNVARSFHPYEAKELTFEEVKKLSYVPGGMQLLRETLLVDNKEACEAIFNENLEESVPEYFYTRAEVKTLLTLGSIDQLADCLNFAPASVIQLIKEEAIALPLNDVEKRDLIKEKTGYDITKALEIKKEAAAPEEEPKTRTATPTAKTTTATATPVRRAAAPITKTTTTTSK